MRQDNFFNEISNWKPRNLKSIVYSKSRHILYGLWRLQNIQGISWIIRQRFGSLCVAGSRLRARKRGAVTQRCVRFSDWVTVGVMRFDSAECTDVTQVNTVQCTQVNVYRYRGCGLWSLSGDARSPWTEAKEICCKENTLAVISFRRRFMRVITFRKEEKYGGYSEDVKDSYNRAISCICVVTWNWNEWWW